MKKLTDSIKQHQGLYIVLAMLFVITNMADRGLLKGTGSDNFFGADGVYQLAQRVCGYRLWQCLGTEKRCR